MLTGSIWNISFLFLLLVWTQSYLITVVLCVNFIEFSTLLLNTTKIPKQIVSELRQQWLQKRALIKT